ncbi:MAG: AraC family transcriptional regulator [Bacteroidota bacterium]
MITSHKHFSLEGKTTFELVKGHPPFRTPAVMDDEACFYYIIKGKSRVFSPYGRIESLASNGLALQCGNYIAEFAQNQDTSFEAMAVHLHKDHLRSIFQEELSTLLEDADSSKAISHRSYSSSRLLSAYIDSLAFYFKNPHLVSDELQRLKIKELLLLLAKSDRIEEVKKLVNGLFTTEHPRLVQIVERHLTSRVNLEELAFLCQMSLSTFKRAFKRHYGEAPASYLRRKRLEMASELLKTSDQSIAEVAEECGFADPAHFTKSFAKAFGQTPSEFRAVKI